MLKVMNNPPNPLPLMRATAKYHREQMAYHERAAARMEAAISVLEEQDGQQDTELVPIDKTTPVTRRLKAFDVEDGFPLPQKTTTKTEFVEELVRASGIEGITAIAIRSMAKSKEMDVAPNFPYRQLGRMAEAKKVWKDKNGKYFHGQVVPVPQGSAQEVTQ
jgi:hypothetical protein